MKKGLFGSIATLLTGAGLALAEAPPVAAPIISAQPAATYAASENFSVSGGSGSSASNSLWFSAEYLLWQVKDHPMPALVTAGSQADFNPGAIDQLGTQVLIGNRLSAQPQTGLRLNGGYWFDEDQSTGAEVSFFFLGKRTVSQYAASSGSPSSSQIGFAFYDLTLAPPAQNFFSLSQPEGIFPGLPGIGATSRLTISNQMWGTEANSLFKLACGDGWKLHGLLGVRYMDITEKLALTSTVYGTGILMGANQLYVDQFNTRNDFYGAQAGVRGEYTMDRWFINATGKFGLGDNHQILDIGGMTNNTGVGVATQTFPGGWFTNGQNIGHFHRDKIAILPELTVNVGANVTDNLRASVGYNFLYMNHTLRPGNTISTQVNSSQSFFNGNGGNPIIGTPGPNVVWNEADFWAQGISLGLEFRY